jgi:hypothetical protein
LNVARPGFGHRGRATFKAVSTKRAGETEEGGCLSDDGRREPGADQLGTKGMDLVAPSPHRSVRKITWVRERVGGVGRSPVRGAVPTYGRLGREAEDNRVAEGLELADQDADLAVLAEGRLRSGRLRSGRFLQAASFRPQARSGLLHRPSWAAR